ncbi:fimbrial biogenesis outer membrane usher protein [Pseudomonas sp. 1912-s]|uniref:fimbria/pilus outer membrane usher protein n=1 Tax=Pseudomonas sp. 1912-s TaxID=3033802 RepID=UPI0023DF6013|nr:fimbria/pilus outer membrane usher protein [Pseudomonas sp. 1912-s]MDF3202865.1 fimbrial biogenesis outer membrane usher protein [Pseudomonas sp. 1912-s]
MKSFLSHVEELKNPKFRFGGVSPYLAALGALATTHADAAQFNPMFLKDKGVEVDLRYFEHSSGVIPGTYSVDLYLNQRLVRRQEVTFQMDADAESADPQPVLMLGLLRDMGVNIQRLKQEGIISSDIADEDAVELLRIDGASVEIDMAKLSLFVSIPQAYIQRRARGYVDPSLWDEGIPAVFSSYQLNFSRNTGDGFNSDYGYLGLRNGLNIGQWRLRNDSSLSQGTGTVRMFTSNRSYLEHDVTRLKGRFALGQLYSNGDIFDSSRFIGVQLGSDIGMLPDDESGYAPVVHGIAETQATVEVRQNGYVIYSTAVSPGAFEIRDIYPGGSNGDLEITIIESDGRERKYSQAYAYLPVMTRRGNFQYSLSLGKYDYEGAVSPNLVQGTAVYGATDNLTTYGGAQAAEGYTALNLGVGLNSALGGTSVDVTNSHSRVDASQVTTGQSVRFLYSKTLSKTNTTFTMAGYRYSTSGYRTLSEHIDELDPVNHYSTRGRPKHRLDLSINQTIGHHGSLFLSAGETNYWDRAGNTRRLQVGYSGGMGLVSYSVSASHTQSADRSHDSDNQLAFSVSVPFGDRNRSQRLYSNISTDGKGQDNLQSGVAGYLNDKSTLSYSAQAGLAGNDRSSGVGIGWDAPSAKLAANYSTSGPSRHLDMTASGSVVVHSGGVTFGQPVGETFALVEVAGVKGASVEGSTAQTDSAGYTIQSYVQPYRYNWVNLDAQTLGSDVDVTETSQQLVPRRGSVVKARFEASTGRRVLFDLLQANGKKLPFGAQLFDEENTLLAVVDNQSRALVFGIKEHGRLTLNWASGQCTIPYKLPQRDLSLVYDQVEAACDFKLAAE